ncbi:unnamed protein product [Peronospora belbahrii]|uniref:Uncharacterized protein n=1 Tax=Peronospora belbahrii TaxID=622444 RepID=A0AAU9KJP4_9STRA|nr:unnamed protein product [Peronospora belbahrii]CAH0521780.1 unnamed protein product [Peronospora belbahrii]
MMTSPMTSPQEAATATHSRLEKPLYMHLSIENDHVQRMRTVATLTSTIDTRKDAMTSVNESSDMRSQTCVEFLHIMKEFSESSCDANETVQRVDSLVNQDEQLLRLFPLSRTQEEDEAARRLRRALEDEDDESIATVEVKGNEKEMDTQDELQRWMDLDLDDIDHHMDVFDFQHNTQPLAMNKITTNGTNSNMKTTLHMVKPTASLFVNHGINGFLEQNTTDASKVTMNGMRGQSTITSQKLATTSVASSLLSDKYVAAALVEDDDDDDLHVVVDNAALSSGPLLKRAKVLPAVSTQGLRVPVLLDAESKAETDDESKADEDEEGNVWGMASDNYEHDLLSSIDHAVLCDRENRFLQWDLEAAQRHQLQKNSLSVNALTSAGMTDQTSIGAGISSKSALSELTAIQTQRSIHQPSDKIMAASPFSSKSSSNVDIVEDWNNLDFGTFQNRTVSHILSSCLHKRKLHHPYKNQVQLVNFNVPGCGKSNLVHGSGPPAHQLGGSLATSLAFGGQQHGFDGTDGSAISGFEPLLASRHDNDHVSSKSPGKGEKKIPKKREERKRLMTLKMQETFADLEGTFTEQDLDVKGIVGPGASLSKMALSKLENLPLPDLMNLPQELRELKRKIEATEHKVEGTKHRHRKGGPCPRCQVQNQLRAAKRAYHKRAVAHKKLPHVVVNAVNDEAQEAANAQAAAAATLELAGNVTAAMKAAAGAGARKGINVPFAGASGNGSSAKARAAMTGMPNMATGVLKQMPHTATSFVPSPSSSLCSTSSVVTTGTVGSTSGSSSSSTCGGVSPPPSLSIQARVRESYVKVSSSAMPFSSPSSASPTSASNPSSPETASRQLQHVTVSSG